MFRNGLEPWHIILVVVVAVLLFGSKKLPDAARGLGKSLRILKAETRALREDGSEPETPAPAPAAEPRPAPKQAEALDISKPAPAAESVPSHNESHPA